ncbi:nuclear transport factor 2 family protein [Streptomyces spiralis]
MSSAIKSDSGRLSDERAREVLRAAERAWHERDLEALIAALHPEVRIRFNNLPEVCGIDAAREWLQRRFDTQLDYRLEKTLRGVDGSMIVSSWTGRWRDAPTGEVRLCRGIELLTLDGDVIRDWEGVMHVWDEEA